MRDLLAKEEYFISFYTEMKKLIGQSKERISNKIITGEKVPLAKHRIFGKSLEMLISRYSKGDSIQEIKSEYSITLDLMVDGWDELAVKFYQGRPPNRIMLDKYFLMPYNYMIWMLSLAILLKVSKKDTNTLKSIIEEGNIKDRLIIMLLSSLTGSQTVQKTEETTYNPFSGLFKIDKLIDTERQMESYLDKWYKKTKLLTWHNYKPDNERYFYFGRWCFEAAAVTCIKGLDDSSYRDHPYYPKDLADYYRANQ